MNCIIENHGRNDFPLPHMNKSKLEKAGELPTVLRVTSEARALFAAFSNPDFTAEDAWDEESVDLAGKVSKREIQELMNEAAGSC